MGSLFRREQIGLHEDQDLETLRWVVVAAVSSLDALEAAPEVSILLPKHGNADSQLSDPRLEGSERVTSFPQFGEGEADREQEALSGAEENGQDPLVVTPLRLTRVSMVRWSRSEVAMGTSYV